MPMFTVVVSIFLTSLMTVATIPALDMLGGGKEVSIQGCANTINVNTVSIEELDCDASVTGFTEEQVAIYSYQMAQNLGDFEKAVSLYER